MTAAAALRAPRSGLAEKAAGVIACAALYAATHVYPGVDGDAKIYVSRELARRDPAGLGADLMFVHDTQTDFTIFPRLLGALMDVLPAGEAARLAAACGLAVFLIGVAILSRALSARMEGNSDAAPWRAAVVMVLFVAVLPLGYSSSVAFVAGEPLAIPRPFAEGAALAALGFAATARWRSAVAALVVSILFNPLIGLCAGATLFAFLAMSDRRWLTAGAVGALALVVAAFAGAPMAGALFVRLDPPWEALLRARTPYLFIAGAPFDFWAETALRALTLWFFASVFGGTLARLAVAAILAALGGLLASLIGADLLKSQLVVQLQAWRATWVLAVMAPMALAMLATRAPTMGQGTRLALLALAAGWAFKPLDSTLTLACALSCLALHAARGRLGAMRPPVERALWIALFALVAAFGALGLLMIVQAQGAAPPGADLRWRYVMAAQPLVAPTIVLALAWFWRPSPTARRGLAGAAAALALFAATIWDDRPAAVREVEARRAPPDLRAAASDEGSALWLGGDIEAWWLLGRPAWFSRVQGASIVFSRAQALAWAQRADVLIELGLARRNVLDVGRGEQEKIRVTADALSRLCARADAPRTIVAPLADGETPLPGARRLDLAPTLNLKAGESGLRWEREARQVLRCSDL